MVRLQQRSRGALWALLLCALVTLCWPADALAWTCDDDVPASLPAATASQLGLPFSRLVNCGPELRVPLHLQAAICTLDGASEVAPMPVSPRDDGELSNGDVCFDIQVATVAPADEAPSHAPPNQPPDAALPDALKLVVDGYAYDIQRRPNDTSLTPAHGRGVYRPPRG